MLLEEWHDLFAVELGNEIAGQHGVTGQYKQVFKNLKLYFQLTWNQNNMQKILPNF